MSHLRRPLVLIHGLWDNPRLFNGLISSFNQSDEFIYTPHLPHDFGRTSISKLAIELNHRIINRFDDVTSIDLLGFSMGGLIGRFWVKALAGCNRTMRFCSFGSPQQGTLTAQLIASFMFNGIAEMKLGSKFLCDLNKSKAPLKGVDCVSFYSNSDLMVFPGWRAVLPYGHSEPLPVLTHKGLIKSSKAIRCLKKAILFT